MSDEKIKLELGGGKNRLPGYLNIDDRGEHSGDHIVADLIAVGSGQRRLEFSDRSFFPDDSVCEVYSSHCFEHIEPLDGLIAEICRGCHNGAKVQIRVPHWGSPEAMCAGHKHVITPKVVHEWCERVYHGKKLDLVTTMFMPSEHYERAAALFPNYTIYDLSLYVPATMFESQFSFNVQRVS